MEDAGQRGRGGAGIPGVAEPVPERGEIAGRVKGEVTEHVFAQLRDDLADHVHVR